MDHGRIPDVIESALRLHVHVAWDHPVAVTYDVDMHYIKARHVEYDRWACLNYWLL